MSEIPDSTPDLEGLRVEERDARMAVYRDRERRRATLALDRYVELVYGGSDKKVSDVAADRLVEAVGDYVLSRLHHSGHYGVSERCDAEADTPGYTCKLPKGHEGRHALGNGWQFDTDQPRNPDYVADCGRDDCGGPGHLFGPRQQCAGRRPQPVDNDRFPAAGDVQNERWPRGQ